MAWSSAELLEGLEHLVGLEKIEGIVLNLHPAHDTSAIQDEVRPFAMSVERTLLIRHQRAIGPKHLTARVGQQHMFDAVGPDERRQRVWRIDAHAHDLGARGFELGEVLLEAADLRGSD